ncbi:MULTISPECIES: DUF4259 domain-containing protein [Duganella]|jgi:hypothetical protein|uniref:DUF4259 domain-containing protein n=1 Tax=Duganella TaxID=75654 RepID=UPI0030EA17CD
MGTWAVDAFGNDYAQDWAEDLKETSNLDAVENTLDVALEDNGDELEMPFAVEALVAIEVLARLQGKGGARTEDSAAVDDWVDARKPKARLRTDLAEKAGRAIERILSERSELRELWEESEHYQEWLASVEDLRSRLTA